MPPTLNDLILPTIFGLVSFFLVGVLWISAVILTIINRAQSRTKRALWLLAEIFIFPISSLYLLIVEKRWIWRMGGAVGLFVIGLFVFSPTRHAFFFYPAMENMSQSFRQYIAEEDRVTGADLCAECRSEDLRQSEVCSSHLAHHLIKEENRGTYCPAKINVYEAERQVSVWCKKVGPYYSFPNDLWTVIHTALIEKYACPH